MRSRLATWAEHQEQPREDHARQLVHGQADLVVLATRTTEVRGVPIEEGSTVQLFWRAANRDPAEYDRPDDVVLDRSALGTFITLMLNWLGIEAYPFRARATAMARFLADALRARKGLAPPSAGPDRRLGRARRVARSHAA
jgi:hypothetical protein